MDDISVLIARRGQIKAIVTRFQGYIGSTECDMNQIILRRKKVEEAWYNFERVQLEIEELDCANGTDHSGYREDFENAYFEAMAKAEQMMNVIRSSSGINTNEQGETSPRTSSRVESIGSASSSIKLAALNIPVFNGDYADWTSFHDIFVALIHTNINLTPIQKFFYLRSSLVNEPANCIKNLETTANNYEHAWKTLITRYRNEKLLVQSHVKGIYELSDVRENSSNSLRQFSDTLRGHISALEALKQQPYDWGPLLTHIICTKLDAITLSEWETKSSKNEISKVADLILFLDSRSQILEAIESSKNISKIVNFVSENKNDYRKNKINKNYNASTSFVSTAEIKCYACDLSHTIYKCPSFLSLAVADRIKRVNELGLCKVCLRKHDVKRCLSRNNCYKCHKAHNTLLHLIIPQKYNEKKSNETLNQQTVSTSTSAHASGIDHENVILSTAVVRAIGKCAITMLCRSLLDSGSQSNFITEEIVQVLKLKKIKTTHQVNGIGSVMQHVHSYVHARFESRFSDYNLSLKMLVVPKITGDLPTKNITNLCGIPENIKLADPSFQVPQKIDILIGATHFYDLLGDKKIKPHCNGPIFQETKLGWVVSGPVSSLERKTETTIISTAHHATSTHTEPILENILPCFWRMEEVKIDVPFTTEEKMCKKYFDDTVARGKDGRFIVHLPFRNNNLKIGNSYNIAKRRFLSLERRLENNTELKNEYVKFINEYKELGHLEQIFDDQYVNNVNTCYLPHHAVVKESSTSTRVRVVFDASCKSDNGVSLNDLLLKGPVLQDDLLFILTRFRTHNYVLSADIIKMYRQFWITDEHRSFQRILWREDPSEPIKIFQLKTITYGTVPASFLATGCLGKLAETIHNTKPEVSAAIIRDFYMDDFLGDADTLEAAMQLRDGLIEVLGSAGLKLQKWSSNNINLISDLSTDVNNYGKNIATHENIDNAITKILGLYWSSNADTLQFEVHEKHLKNSEQSTKREILSKIVCLFDPLGLIGPAIIRAKLILQQLWLLKVQWDEPLPTSIQDEWKAYRTSLISLNNLVVPRKIMGDGKIINVQIHGFADASIEAYGRCLFLRSTNSDGVHTSKLICAKSKVAPLKVVSLPRLELCAAVLLARLANRVIPKMQLGVTKNYFWSDSNIVLAWISSQSTRWRTFVAHRVGEIQEKTSLADWAHVDTKDNPADIISRGCCPSKLTNMPLWWYGPDWLIKDEKDWPKSNENEKGLNIEIPEARSVTLSAVDVMPQYPSLINRFSCVNKLIRIVAHCLRFVYNNSRKNSKLDGVLSVEEVNRARTSIIKCIQKEAFSQEIRDLTNLNKIAGEDAKCHFTRLIFKYEHERCMHGGPQAMLCSVRSRYWPLNGRNLARSTIHECVTCFRYKPVVVQPIMGNLPMERVEPTRAFLRCGIYYAGPFMIKTSMRRNAPLVKGYVCIFVCFSTKAVHIELVGELSTAAFINALNRFFDRRGRSTTIFTDNATNFVGANRKMKEWSDLFNSEQHKKKVQEALTDVGVQWRFIPPRSPHFGGLWEAAVKSMKHLLQKTVGNAHLLFEELSHFLIGDSLLSILEPDLSNIPTIRLTRWRKVTQYSRTIWQRWSREYLNQLQERKRWAGAKGPKLEVGTVVLIREDNIPPLKWRLGRVIKITAGSDGVVRVAEVRTSTGQFTRAIEINVSRRAACCVPGSVRLPINILLSIILPRRSTGALSISVDI
ncbi:Integrase catalytic domain-containing protein, partial [Aphis craccivora]